MRMLRHVFDIACCLAPRRAIYLLASFNIVNIGLEFSLSRMLTTPRDANDTSETLLRRQLLAVVAEHRDPSRG
jgi:hypothetical protein